MLVFFLFQSAFAGEWLEKLAAAVCPESPTCFNPLSLESGWRRSIAFRSPIRLAGFNPLSLESGWRSLFVVHWHNDGFGFNPLSLESGWRRNHTGNVAGMAAVSIRFRWRVVGEGSGKHLKKENHECFNPLSLESGWRRVAKAIAAQQPAPVSIRFRWRVVGEGLYLGGKILDSEFQSAFAGEWLEKSGRSRS